MSDTHGFDALLPADMAAKAEQVGVAKAALPLQRLVPLGVLAGAFIGLGANFSQVITADTGLSPGIRSLLGGVVFSLGLILVVVSGAELFAGNTLIVCPATNAWYPALAQLKTVDSVLGSSQIFPTLSSAVAAAVSGRGDTIVVTPGVYTQTAELLVDKNNLTIVGVGGSPEATKVTGPAVAGKSALKVTANNVLIQNLHLVGNVRLDLGEVHGVEQR